MRIPIELPPGMISDDTTFSTPGTVEDGSNVRCWRNRWQVIGGWTIAFDDVLGKCRTVMTWSDNSGTRCVGMGTHSHLQVHLDGVTYDITPSGLAAGAEDGVPGAGWGVGEYGMDEYGNERPNSSARTWSLSTYGETLMACPKGGTIYQWSNNTANDAVAVTNAPAAVYYMLVTPERQVLAFGCNEEVSTDFNPLCIRGSDIEDPTDWTTASDNNAFEHILEGGGRIVAARMIGNYVAVWTDNSVYLGQFIGQIGQAYRFDQIAVDHGLIGPNAVAIVGQTAYWIGPDCQFRAWQLGGAPAIIPCPIRRAFQANLADGQEDKIVASPLGAFGEVWFFYPDSRDGLENSRYLAVSTIDGSWFRGEMERTAFCDAGVAGYPIGISPDGDAFYHELGLNANGGPLAWHLKTSDFYLDESRRHLFIRGIRPDFEDQSGGISLTLYPRKYPQAEAVTKGPYSLAPGAGKKDFRASGAVISFKLAGASNPSFMRLGKLVFDAVPTGER